RRHDLLRRCRRGLVRLFLLQPPRGFLFGTAARILVSRLARFFFGLAFLGGVALALQLIFFDGAFLRFFFGAFACFVLGHAGVGQSPHAGVFFVFRELAQHHSGARRGPGAGGLGFPGLGRRRHGFLLRSGGLFGRRLGHRHAGSD